MHGPFLFTEVTVTGDSFVDMLRNWLLRQLNNNYDDYLLQLDGDPSPPFSHECMSAGSDVLQNGDNNLLPWPPRSPDLTPCYFFPWGFAKGSVYMPPLPTPIQELRDWITHALQAITADMLHRVWDEFDYCVDCVV
jgi:hypothetical protein